MLVSIPKACTHSRSAKQFQHPSRIPALEYQLLWELLTTVAAWWWKSKYTRTNTYWPYTYWFCMGLQWTLVVPYIIMNLQLVVIEWMYTAVRQSEWSMVLHHTHGGTTQLNYMNVTQQWHSKQVVHRCVWKVKGTSKHGTYIGVQRVKGIETCHYTMNIKKALKYVNNFESYQLRNLCTAGSGKHFWYYTPTQLCMYKLNHRHICTGVCIQIPQVVREHTYTLTWT